MVKKATPAKGAKVNAKNGKAAKKAESEDEEDDAGELLFNTQNFSFLESISSDALRII